MYTRLAIVNSIIDYENKDLDAGVSIETSYENPWGFRPDPPETSSLDLMQLKTKASL